MNNLSMLTQARLDELFHLYLVKRQYLANDLQHAMTYAVKNGGKYMRPLLIYSIGQTFQTPLENLDAPACAIELIHAYSLIHDDLPAMDNSDLRRGKPSCHKAFSESTAILAGDALQSLAFEVITDHPCDLNSQQRLEMVSVLSHASGISGMAGGQALDLAGVASLDALNMMYQLKTGALFKCCIKLACIASRINDPIVIKALEIYISNIGLAFQIQDDLLDVQGDTTMTGKPVGLDNANNKITYPGLLGIEETQRTIDNLFHSALDAIKVLGDKSEQLTELAFYIMRRKK
jgi:geranylgeranyl pyrophosphate synthase